MYSEMSTFVINFFDHGKKPQVPLQSALVSPGSLGKVIYLMDYGLS